MNKLVELISSVDFNKAKFCDRIIFNQTYYSIQDIIDLYKEDNFYSINNNDVYVFDDCVVIISWHTNKKIILLFDNDEFLMEYRIYPERSLIIRNHQSEYSTVLPGIKYASV